MRTPDTSTLERLVPDDLDADDITGLATLALHVQRYRFAASHLRPGRVLDIACGVGYGAPLLAARPDVRVLGVDVSEDAIAYAQARNHDPRVEFRVADALDFEDSDGFDTIVSLETVEHVVDADLLIARLAGLLRPGGCLIGSVPTTPSTDLNPHYRRDFSERSFRRLISRRAPALREVAALRQVQAVSPLRVLARSERRMRDLRASLPHYYLAHPGSLVRRILATLRFGFSNRYLTVAWRMPPAPPP